MISADFPDTNKPLNDLVIIRVQGLDEETLPTLVKYARALLSDGGQVLFIEQNAAQEDDFVDINSQTQTRKMLKALTDILALTEFHRTIPSGAP